MVGMPKNRVGLTGLNKHGSEMIITKYNNALDLWVEFEKGKPIHTTFNNFIKGQVRNPYDKTIYGVGFLGEGEFKAYISTQTPTIEYKLWSRVMERCYCDSYLKKRPSYIGCSVDQRWYSFQNFAKWYGENYYEVEDEMMHLDKDILVKGNKIYSPETCVFVPARINMLFTKSNAKRGMFPIGVSLYNGRYKAYSNNSKGKKVTIGSYDSIEEAFHSYKTFKEKVIKEVAEEYKDRIPNSLYESLLQYKVEITD
jgi:hypothetical protein